MIATIKVELPKGYRVREVIAVSDKERFPMVLQIIKPIRYSGSDAEAKKLARAKPKRRS